MNWSLEIFTSLVGVLATTIVGFVLYKVIQSQRDVINGMKSYMDIFDMERVKSYADLRDEETELKYSKKLREETDKLKTQLNSVDENARAKAVESFITRNAELIDRFEEITSSIVNFALTLKSTEREKFLSNFPKNREMLVSFVAAIERGEVQPGKSTDLKDASKS